MCQKSDMDSFHKPSALSFEENTSENWRRFKQQFDIFITTSGSEKKDDVGRITTTNQFHLCDLLVTKMFKWSLLLIFVVS